MWINRRQATLFCGLALVLFVVGGVLPGSARDDVKVFLALGDVESAAHYLLSACLLYTSDAADDTP